ncbi:hypothetical protein HC028_18510 [Planosporangium flavigriseum]|uniref:Uncharacterized protein n=1 Tax=Planosporangium flavigriseum TaxID=373681 RepID=A0A8J3LNE7_9ACTN|nr:hypothetical protein [Planosporangium flavigriseum]NJC66481.1 hypothetical protein [Planosporangium flavigriseum]GIG76358.1 hypothetical protein Pfl04_47620 [Planosporangium flavigriseum]
MTDPAPSGTLTQEALAAIAEYKADPQLPGRPHPALTPTSDSPLLDVRPALVPGHATGDADAIGFDPQKVIASLDRRPTFTGTGHVAGDFDEPPSPITPPPGVEVPADLAAAYRVCEERRQAWEAAVDAVQDYQDDARQSRTRRAAAIREAGRAAAQGKKRPPIPAEISEAEEATEVQVLSEVVRARFGEARAAAHAADKLIGKYAADWAALTEDRFGPELDAATAAVQAAVERVGRAGGTRHSAAFWRSLAIAEDLAREGVRVTERDRQRIASDLLDAITHPTYRAAEGQRRAALDLLGQTHEALGLLRQCNPGAVPHPDALRLPGPADVARRVYQAVYDGATDEQKRIARSGHRY